MVIAVFPDLAADLEMLVYPATQAVQVMLDSQAHEDQLETR